MPQSLPAFVEPAVLSWARESIGLTPVSAARKIGVPDDRVRQWESGETRPTVAQLRKAATVYKRPLGVFFLARPPADFDTMRDFRRHDVATSSEWSPQLHGEYRRAHTQREHLLELAELEDEQPPTTWRIESLPETDEEIGAVAREVLLRTAPIAFPSGAATQYEYLNAWVAAVEEAGIMVLATQHGGVLKKEMRAFSLYFDLLPVAVVNGSDAARGRLFSVIHEYAHLLLHTAGLCDTITDTSVTTPDRRLEARCNAIAAAVLMPRDQVLSNPYVVEREGTPERWEYEALRSAAAPFGVSAEAFLRRLLTLGRVSREFYQAKRDEFLVAYEEEARRGSGGNWYRNTARDLGKAYVRRVADAHERRVIDSYTAASFLDVKVDQIQRLAAEAGLQVLA